MTPGRTLRIAAFACTAGLAAAACGGSSGDDAAVQDDPVATTAAAPASTDGAEDAPDSADADISGAVVPAALQFTAPLVGGGELVGDELAGKPTAFWFWSPT